MCLLASILLYSLAYLAQTTSSLSSRGFQGAGRPAEVYTVVPLACLGFPGGILNRCSCHLIRLIWVEELRLDTQPLPDEQASHPICKAEPGKVVSAVNYFFIRRD